MSDKKLEREKGWEEISKLLDAQLHEVKETLRGISNLIIEKKISLSKEEKDTVIDADDVVMGTSHFRKLIDELYKNGGRETVIKSGQEVCQGMVNLLLDVARKTKPYLEECNKLAEMTANVGSHSSGRYAAAPARGDQNEIEAQKQKVASMGKELKTSMEDKFDTFVRENHDKAQKFLTAVNKKSLWPKILKGVGIALLALAIVPLVIGALFFLKSAGAPSSIGPSASRARNNSRGNSSAAQSSRSALFFSEMKEKMMRRIQMAANPGAAQENQRREEERKLKNDYVTQQRDRAQKEMAVLNSAMRRPGS